MQHITAAALLALAVTASAADSESGRAVVQNNCDFPLHIWTTCNGDEVTPWDELPPGATWADLYGEGTCEVKVAQSDKALENGEPQSGLVYSVDGDEVRYSLTHVLGTFFAPLKADADSDDCGVIEWEDGPGGDLQQSCGKDAMIRISLCGDESPDGSPEQSGAAESSGVVGGEEGEEEHEEEVEEDSEE